MRARALDRQGRVGPLMTIVSMMVLVVSCGGDGDSARSTTSATPATTTASPPTTAASPPTTVATHTMQSVLDDLRAESAAPGVLALVRTDDGEWFGSSGSANLDGAAIQASTRFRIGSITKTLTAALVLDAVSRGELALDDAVQTWTPEVLPAEPAITMQMLLSHTSGIFNAGDEGDIAADIARISDATLRQQAQDLGARYLAGESVIAPADVLIALARTHPLYFEPGVGYHYSNINYQIATMVLEAATGKDFATLLQERIVAPLGLASTTSAPDDLRWPDMRSYTKDPDTDALADSTTDLLAVGNGGSGGVVSTAGELLAILQAIDDGDLIAAPLTEEMVTPTEQSLGTYGLGVVTFDLACGYYLGHGGAIAGMHTLALVSPDASTGVVIAANLRGDPEPNLLGAAEDLLCDDR